MVDYRQFFEKIRIDRASSNVNCVSMSKSKYDDLVNKVKLLKTNIRKEGNDYRFLKRYDILEVNGVTKLISPVNESACVKYFVHDEELHDVLHDAHFCTGHGGRDRMMKNLKRKYMNVTYKDVQTYLSLCEPCLQKQKSQKKKVVTIPMLFQDLNSRCQVGLIDFQSQPDEEYKFIMVYQDHLTKFVVLKPLKSKRAEEVCDNIIDIFTLLGAPSVLQSDNGREFANIITNNLKNVWPNFKIVHGKPRHSQSQGSVERANQDVENMLTTWMQDNKTSHWSQGLRYVQLMKNCAFHSGVKRSPYEAMFGCPPKHGLASSGIPAEAVENVTSEEELEEVIIRINMASEEATEQETEPEINTTQFPDRENLFEEESGNVEDECILTDLGQSTELIRNQREEAFNSLSDQAKRMKRSSVN